jgi:Ni,Fe-hydrogenase III large subunit
MSMELAALIRSGVAVPCKPYHRYLLPPDAWRGLGAALAATPGAALVALWADTAQVHALIRNDLDGDTLLASVPVEAGAYPALSPACPATASAAAWFERAIADLWGHRAEAAADERPWLDHGRWPLTWPMAARPVPMGPPPEAPVFTSPAGGTHQVPVGPVPFEAVRGGVGAAAHLRLHAAGTVVAAAEARLGYAHRGVLALMRGKPARVAARFAARLAGEATVAHSLGFALAVEAALDVAPPERAAALREVMVGLELVAETVDALGVLRAAVGLDVAAARCARAREMLARAVGAAFGHRLMMDAVVPGGVAADLAANGEAALLRALSVVAEECDAQARLHARHAGFAARLRDAGVVPRAIAASFAAPDAAGDTLARDEARLARLAAAVPRVRARLARLPEGALTVALPVGDGEGIGHADGPRGAVWYWLRLEGGAVAAAFARDPGWALWPLLERAVAGMEMEDVPVVIASLRPSVPGMDV